jgi:Holliday junction DNA helicase RuvA
MIALLRGAIAQRDLGSAIVDVNGVGYLVQTPATVSNELVVGEQVVFHISTAVREDAITLYGFVSAEDRSTFEMLREVNGVGPRTALGILSQMGRTELHRAISNEEITTLTKLKGLGKKTAERLILELKNKIPQTFTPMTINGQAPQADPLPLALAQLDYRRTEIDRAMSSADVPAMDDAPVGARLQAALRVLSRPM